MYMYTCLHIYIYMYVYIYIKAPQGLNIYVYRHDAWTQCQVAILRNQLATHFTTCVKWLNHNTLQYTAVGMLDALWLNRLNVLLPPPQHGVQGVRDAVELMLKSVLDSIVYGGLSNSFGIIVRRCLFKSESLRDALAVWRHCILQVRHVHCSTLQHTATHCNTLQHSATHWKRLSTARCARCV